MFGNVLSYDRKNQSNRYRLMPRLSSLDVRNGEEEKRNTVAIQELEENRLSEIKYNIKKRQSQLPLVKALV